jgi:hypothetical protein
MPPNYNVKYLDDNANLDVYAQIFSSCSVRVLGLVEEYAVGLDIRF